eukprot:6205003-Pleurochrysis_carterae.AAC.3
MLRALNRFRRSKVKLALPWSCIRNSSNPAPVAGILKFRPCRLRADIEGLQTARRTPGGVAA